MKRNLKQRSIVTAAMVVAGALFGTVLAFVFAFTLIYKMAEHKLQRDAAQLVAAHDAFDDEARELLTAMNTSPYGFCSDAEIAFFRKLIFNSENYRDAGHMRDGRVACSAMLGKDNLPQTKHVPAVSLPGGMSLLNRFSPFGAGDQRASARQIGNSFVNLDPSISKRMSLINPNRSLTVIDAVTHKPTHPGFPFLAPDAVKNDRNWEGQVGDTLYATRCDAANLSCITTYARIPELLQSHRNTLSLAVALGGIVGSFVGFSWAFLQFRDRSMGQRLRSALQRDHLFVVYQPVVLAATRRIVGAEALVRWNDEDGSPVSPEVFVKVAEAGGFVGSITELVVRHALRDFSALLASHPKFRLSINVAAADLSDPKFLPMLEQSLQRASVRSDSITIEITESSTARHDVAKETIRKLRERGHAIHIDDFGTGYSSLSYLRELSVDAIKIDKSFTQAIGTEAVTQSILPQILAMARTLSLHVIVEGVETEAQAGYFAAMEQPILAQGWLFGRPVTVDRFPGSLTRNDDKDSAAADAA
jgi:sensor c-di-GMP phosphodiesterase-like protein